MAKNWQERAQRKMDRKRRTLEEHGCAPADANGQVEWAHGLATRRAPPEKGTDEFLRELDHQLPVCDQLARR